ncbi:MAG: maleylpyruvate isomerase N-terminal domain-containing protein [Rhizobiales bacterium]|nr:maleylpyruvate isomerase N-terminal domain-containing protein [Hyphomicrobiales bacterium]OJY06247.1 MAG: hypothetical protein BGP07_01295 [Rhizobiales bacterium 63-22]
MPLSDAQSRLPERLSAGARYDSARAPKRELGWARGGTAYFARLLNELRDDELDYPSLLPGRSRRHVVAEIGYQARALARSVELVRGASVDPIFAHNDQLREEAKFALSLRSDALRHLFKHSEVHLNVEWRDLDDDEWDRNAALPGGGQITPRQTVPIRSISLWLRGVALNNGGRLADVPRDLLEYFHIGNANQEPREAVRLARLPAAASIYML